MFNRTQSSIIIIVSAIVMFGFYCIFTIVPAPQEYTNMTNQQSDAQTSQWFTQQAHACQDAGGDWIVGGASAGCDVEYTQPDTSWYRTPISNPWYSVYENSLAGVVVGYIIIGMIVLESIFSIIFSFIP